MEKVNAKATILSALQVALELAASCPCTGPKRSMSRISCVCRSCTDIEIIKEARRAARAAEITIEV